MRAERLCNQLARADAHPHTDTVAGAHPSMWSNHYPVGNRSSGFDHHAVLCNGNRDRHKRRCWRHHLLGAAATPGGRGRLSGSSAWTGTPSAGDLFWTPPEASYPGTLYRNGSRTCPGGNAIAVFTAIGTVYSDLRRRPRAIGSLKRCRPVSGRSSRFVAGREVEVTHFGNGMTAYLILSGP
jgi:hypothetical protein